MSHEHVPKVFLVRLYIQPFTSPKHPGTLRLSADCPNMYPTLPRWDADGILTRRGIYPSEDVKLEQKTQQPPCPGLCARQCAL